MTNNRHDDDLTWLELMAGRTQPDAMASTRQEAAWLRAAMLNYRADAPAGQMPSAELRISKLLDRANKAGILQPHSTTQLARHAWGMYCLDLLQTLWRSTQGLAMAAGLLLSVMTGYWATLPRLTESVATPADTPVERSNAVQVVYAANPAQRQQAMLQALRAANLDVMPFERLGHLGFDVEVPTALSTQQHYTLMQQGLQARPGAVLVVEIWPSTHQTLP